MADNTAIAWTHHTFNPWMGCFKVSDGCKNCYAETLVSGRMGRPGLWGPPSKTARQVTSPANWRKPLKWNKEAELRGIVERAFCASLADVFEDHPTANANRARLFALMASTPYLHWQVLTKRPENILKMLPDDWGVGYPNVWLGTSVEDMRVAERVDHLRTIPAPVRWISYEPALGPLDALSLTGLDWVVYGGESGPGWRLHNLDWARTMKAKCEADGVAFFYKQGAAPRTEMHIELDGKIVRRYPVPRVTHGLSLTLQLAYRDRALEDRLTQCANEGLDVDVVEAARGDWPQGLL